jgi:hypothetical protein
LIAATRGNRLPPDSSLGLIVIGDLRPPGAERCVCYTEKLVVQVGLLVAFGRSAW